MTFNSQTAASAGYYFAAFTAVLLGVIGSYFHFSVSTHTLIDVIPLRTPVAVIATALGFLIAARSWRYAYIPLAAIGVLFMLLASMSIYGNTQNPHLTLSDFFAWLVVLVACHLFMLGACFVVGVRHAFGRKMWEFTGYLSFLLMALIVTYSWMPNTINPYAPGSVSFIVAGLVMLLVGIMLLIRARWYQASLEIEKSLLIPSVLVSMVTLIIWFSLSAAAVRDINERGQILQEQVASQLDTQLKELRSALQRVAAYRGAESEAVFTQNARLVLNDFDEASAIFVHRADGSLAYQVLPSRLAQTALHTDIAKAPESWLAANFSYDGHMLALDDTGAPTVFLTTPFRADAVPSLQATMVVNLPSLFDFETIEFLQAFRVYAEFTSDALTPITEIGLATAAKEQFEQDNRFAILRVFTLLGEPVQYYVTLRYTDELWRSARINKLVFLIGGIVSFLLVVIIDANKRLRQEEVKLKKLATFDGVTDLIRRDVFEQRLTQRYLSLEDMSATFLLFIDLDGFKTVNDTLGLQSGNHILCAAGQRIRRRLPDDSIVSRFSSDEFVVLTTAHSQAEVSSLSDALLELMRQPYLIDGIEVMVTASIGIAQATSDDSASALVQRADIAMGEAKKSGGNAAVWFQPGMLMVYHQRLQMRTQIQRGLKAHEFSLHYQPIVATKGGQIVAFEALARWFQDDGSSISPGVFISLAEQTGQIIELTEQILEQVALDIPILAEVGQAEQTYISVNISPFCFSRGDIMSRLLKLQREAAHYQLSLLIEVTESLFLDDKPDIQARLRMLREAGIRVAIDDFGTGYSSLSLLYKLPVDVIKIDRSFINELTPGSDALKVASGAISLALNLRKTVVVEGVETDEQIEFCRQTQCHAMQGFYFYKPQSLSDLLSN